MAAKRKKAAKAKRPKARKATRAKKASKGKRRGGGLTQLHYTLSPELQAIVGSRTASRPQVVKKLWVYIKAHKCQDTRNRRMINPDKKLAEVLGSRQIDMLKMAGAISKHLKKA